MPEPKIQDNRENWYYERARDQGATPDVLNFYRESIERRVRAESESCSGCVHDGEQDQWIACTECCRNAPDNYQAATTSK